MKHKYDGLCLDRENPDKQPYSDKCEFFERIATGGRFRFFFTRNRHDYYYPDKDNPLFAKILSVKYKANDLTMDALTIEIDTADYVTPQGIKHGCYTLEFNAALVCDNLPNEMFEE